MSAEETNMPPAAPEGEGAPAAAAPDAYVDENGQPCSKNAYKKRLKAEAALKKKKEKEAAKAAAAAAAPAKKKKEKEEEITDPNLFSENRRNAVAQMEKDGINPYPHKFHVDFRIPDFNAEFETKTTNGEKIEEKTVSIAGRIVASRHQGKLYFYDLSGDGAKVQIMSDPKTYEDEEAFSKIHRMLKRGDIIGVTGFPGKSKNGQLSIFPKTIILLSPCLHMVPFSKGESCQGGITSMETRFRQRYLDLIVNDWKPDFPAQIVTWHASELEVVT